MFEWIAGKYVERKSPYRFVFCDVVRGEGFPSGRKEGRFQPCSDQLAPFLGMIFSCESFQNITDCKPPNSLWKHFDNTFSNRTLPQWLHDQIWSSKVYPNKDVKLIYSADYNKHYS